VLVSYLHVGRGKTYFVSPNFLDRLLNFGSMGNWKCSVGLKWPDVRLTTHLHPVPRLRIIGAIALQFIYSFLACTGTSYYLWINLQNAIKHNSCSLMSME